MTQVMRFAAAALLAAVCLGAGLSAAALQPPPRVEEYVPLDQLPPEDQLPSAPLLIGAYVFVVAGLFTYLFSVARRTSAVQREVERLEADLKRAGRG